MNPTPEVIIGKPRPHPYLSPRIRPSVFSWSTQMNLPFLKPVWLRSVKRGLNGRWLEP